MHIRRTEVFNDWLLHLRDDVARAIIGRRLVRLANGNPGNTRSVGSGVVEMKIDFGPGYRVYYIQRGQALVVLLCGGDKKSQSRDIEQARQLAAQWKED